MKNLLRLLVPAILCLYAHIGTAQQLKVRPNDTTSLHVMVEPLSTNFGAFFGFDAGRKNTGAYNTLLGYGAGQENRGGESNTFIGGIAGQSNKAGIYNSYLGRGAGRLSRGSQNTAIGSEAGALNVNGNNNTFVGRSAGASSTGSNNVFLGYQAGSNETGSNKLYIENSAATSTGALLYGEFDNNYLRVNAGTDIYGYLVVHQPLYGIFHTDGVTNMGTYVDATAGWFGTFSNHPLWFFTNDNVNPTMILQQSGNVGIGTTVLATGYRLSVAGKIAAEEILVDLAGDWPDYVFEDDYQLPSLQQLKASIQSQGHLPNVPSATEVKENGILLGNMNKVLLEKIEELTLYIIQQDERINALEMQVNGKTKAKAKAENEAKAKVK